MQERFKPHTDEGDYTPVNRPEIKRGEYSVTEAETTSEQIKVREILNSFDEQALKSIFAEHFQRAGSELSTMNFIPLSEVRIVTKEKQNGATHSTDGDYGLSRGVTLYVDVERFPNPARILWTLIHEELHAISSDIWRKYHKITDDQEAITTESQVSGFRIRETKSTTHTPVGPYSEKHYESFLEPNEGMTELLTEQIFTEYLHRTGTKREIGVDRVDAVIADHYNPIEKGPIDYSAFRRNIDFFVGIVSILSSIPQDKVLDAICRTYFRNGEFIPYELYDAIEKIDQGLTDKLYSVFDDKEATINSVSLDIADNNNIDPEVKLKVLNVATMINDRRRSEGAKQKEIIERLQKKLEERKIG